MWPEKDKFLPQNSLHKINPLLQQRPTINCSSRFFENNEQKLS